ncbi:MAG TPA: bifunctional diaminohydroxyphosphoribosylaminopyrimidine deaminase/5-amino-6-(5-phosphoribosylamino)uracil reductase RibD [Gemmatimonadales bacterium]|nr:bifunctional diaminohydroxyphosphoribosylaminopyrimidine deaminase/5-amino-6-(5-phosphoribosylamino)uracil reductase RibD [Gemmatimonadales bacterium]
MDQNAAMERALSLAWRGWGRVHPNPLVGAVVLRDGEIVGEGFHAEFGGLHAETAALADAGERARGATVCVTLEPCAHHGKQPPCADALIAAGVRRVVVALRDPNPVADGGLERLQAAGIEVEVGPGAETAARQNAMFLRQLDQPERPWVALKLATSLDARIADRDGRSRWISGPEAREYVHWLRAGFDAIGSGGHTAAVDDSSLTVRGTVEPRVPPARVIFDRSLVLSSGSVLARTAREHRTIVLTARGNAAAAGGLLAAGVEVTEADDLADALATLRRAGIASLLVEGGGRLAGALLTADLVDRYHWIQSPLFLGEPSVAAVSGLPAVSLASAERWTVVNRRALGADTLLVLDREPCLPES